MFFNVSQLMKELSGSTRSYSIDDTLQLQPDAPANNIVGGVSMLKTDEGIWVTALIETVIQCECSRCLEGIEQPLSMQIEEEFLPEFDVATGTRLHTPSDFDDNFYIDHNHILDLTRAIQQYFQINAPMKPICRQECKGMCLTCGVNLNETSCVCDNTQIDPRWGALLELVSVEDRQN